MRGNAFPQITSMRNNKWTKNSALRKNGLTSRATKISENGNALVAV